MQHVKNILNKKWRSLSIDVSHEFESTTTKHLLLLLALIIIVTLACSSFMTRGISAHNCQLIISTLDTFSFDL